MKIYVVGGAIRDVLLGRSPSDVDYVVIGSSVHEMLDQGFQQVGAAFPVFLKNGEEYALARTERKVNVGYTGFETNTTGVTLEEDLYRRDLTINSMAVALEDWESFKDTRCTKLVIDPHGGLQDIQLRVLRHTSEAFQEDPIRVLRTARFAARYGYTVHPATLALMSDVVPEMDSVPAERVWLEIERGLSEDQPHLMFHVLHMVGATETNSLYPYRHAHRKVIPKTTLPVRFASIADNFVEYRAYRIPNDCSELSVAWNAHRTQLVNYTDLSAQDRLDLLQLLRIPSKSFFRDLLLELVTHHTTDWHGHAVKTLLLQDLATIATVDAAGIAAVITSACGNNPLAIKHAIYKARLSALINKQI